MREKSTLLVMIILFSLLLIENASATPVAYGYVTITIVNNPPELSNLRVNETSFDCEADIVDESPRTAKVMKQWFANSVEIDKTKLRYGDEVRCELTPIDELNQEGATYIIEFKIPEPPLKMFFPIKNKF